MQFWIISLQFYNRFVLPCIKLDSVEAHTVAFLWCGGVRTVLSLIKSKLCEKYEKKINQWLLDTHHHRSKRHLFIQKYGISLVLCIFKNYLCGFWVLISGSVKILKFWIHNNLEILKKILQGNITKKSISMKTKRSKHDRSA